MISLPGADFVPDDGFLNLCCRRCQVFFFVLSGKLIPVFIYEVMEPLDCWAFLTIGTDMQDLSHCTIMPGLQLNLDVLNFLRKFCDIVRYRQGPDTSPLVLGYQMGIRPASPQLAQVYHKNTTILVMIKETYVFYILITTLSTGEDITMETR